MAIDPQEVARFKAALSKLTSAEIHRRLDDSVIIRSWKRNLAKGEDGRRELVAEAAQARSTSDATAERRRRVDLSRRVWALVGGAIVAAVALIWAALPQ